MPAGGKASVGERQALRFVAVPLARLVLLSRPARFSRKRVGDSPAN
jgi:hypothetical protein